MGFSFLLEHCDFVAVVRHHLAHAYFFTQAGFDLSVHSDETFPDHDFGFAAGSTEVSGFEQLKEGDVFAGELKFNHPDVFPLGR